MSDHPFRERLSQNQNNVCKLRNNKKCIPDLGSSFFCAVHSKYNEHNVEFTVRNIICHAIDELINTQSYIDLLE